MGTGPVGAGGADPDGVGGSSRRLSGDRDLAVHRGQRRGQGSAAQPHAGRLDRTHRRPDQPEPLPPAAVQAAFTEHAIRLDAHRHQAEGLRRPQRLGQQGGNDSDPAVGGPIPADHQPHRAQTPDGAGQRRGQALHVAAQFVRIERARARRGASPPPRHPQHSGPDRNGLPQARFDFWSARGHGHGGDAEGVGGPQGVLQGGLVGRRQDGPPEVVADRSGQRIDIRAQIGRRQAGDDHALAGAVSHGGTPRPSRRPDRSR